MQKIIIPFLFVFMTLTLEKSMAQDILATYKWETLSAIPDPIGFAGSFAGVANGSLLVAGGANFPDGGAPWTGATKVWSDQIFALENPNGVWKKVGKLPHRLGYGVSINYKEEMIIIGGSNEMGHHAEVFKLTYQHSQVRITTLPSLPEAIANTSGVLVNDVIYIMGGTTTADAKTTNSNFWSMDLSAEKKEWKVLPAWPGPSRMLSVAGAQGGYVYLFSGVTLIDGARKYLKDAYRFSPGSGWELIADLPQSVAAAPSPAFAPDKNHLSIFGGDNGELASSASSLRARHPGFSKQILSYNSVKNVWQANGEIFTQKKEDAVEHPNQSVWAPVTTTLTVWKGKVILPGGEVRPATRTPNVLIAKPIYQHSNH